MFRSFVSAINLLGLGLILSRGPTDLSGSAAADLVDLLKLPRESGRV